LFLKLKFFPLFQATSKYTQLFLEVTFQKTIKKSKYFSYYPLIHPGVYTSPESKTWEIRKKENRTDVRRPRLDLGSPRHISLNNVKFLSYI
jgi:hypothetical protein